MNINNSIIDNLNYYLEIENPEYAFLVSGEWGIGKTHFINNYINSISNDKIKIIKISLFGLTKTSEVNEKIFQELHPILGSKTAKVAGNILKGALSLGFKFDINLDGQPDANINTKLDKIDLPELLLGKENKTKEIVIVLDDLERTNISAGEILGFINGLVEISRIKTILVANERNLLKRDEKDDVYKNFKEKVIGKTFEVKHDFDNVLKHFLKDLNSEHLSEHIEDIKSIYINSNYKNLRKIKQSICDFNYLSSKINDSYLNNKEYCRLLLRSYFALSIEIKSGSLSEERLRKNEPFIKNVNSDIYKKYFSEHPHLYNGNVWADILFKGNLEEINNETSKLVFFIETKKKKIPNWIQLWDFRRIENDEFVTLINEIEDEVNNHLECDLRVYLHKISILLYFSKARLSKLSISDIKMSAQKYTEVHNKSKYMRERVIEFDSVYNSTGYDYINSEDPDFIEIRNMVSDSNKKSAHAMRMLEKQKEATSITNNLISGDIKEICRTLLETYEFTPILNKVDSEVFIKTLYRSSNTVIDDLNKIIYSRYSETKTLNGKLYSEYLKDEMQFWRNVQEKMNANKCDETNLTTHILELFFKNTVSYAIKSLSAFH